MKSEHQQRVEQLMNQIPGQEIPEAPSILDEKNRILRAKLILEEALETIEALGVSVYGLQDSLPCDINSLTFLIHEGKKADWLKVIDSCCDCIVISTGTLSKMGIPDMAVQKAVDDANLSKFEPPKCSSCLTPMIQTYEDCVSSDVVSSVSVGWACINCGEKKPKEAGPYLRDDGKWIKPPYFVAPEIKIKEIILDLGFPASELQ